jgi:hypothetical protein
MIVKVLDQFIEVTPGIAVGILVRQGAQWQPFLNGIMPSYPADIVIAPIPD